MQGNELWFWIIFNVFVLAMLALDLGVFHRNAHAVRFREAVAWSIAWISMAAIFAGGLYLWRGHTPALEFTTGYLVELALSVDNLFVFILIFRFFRVPALYQHKVLFWGILGALIMRAIFIIAGVALISRFHWIVFVFGAWLVYTGIHLAVQKEAEIHPERNPILRWFRRLVPITSDYVNGKFFVNRGGLYATPLFVVLLFVEFTDVMFAADSIPAILAITRDPIIVYTSNVFAVMGLRSLYFALAGMMEAFGYLHYGLSAVLVFIGTKMLVSGYYKIPTVVALGVVAGVLALSMAVSVLVPPKKKLSLPAEEKARIE